MVEICYRCGQPEFEDDGCECDQARFDFEDEDDDDCMNCGVCEWCVERTRDAFEESMQYETAKGEGK